FEAQRDSVGRGFDGVGKGTFTGRIQAVKVAPLVALLIQSRLESPLTQEHPRGRVNRRQLIEPDAALQIVNAGCPLLLAFGMTIRLRSDQVVGLPPPGERVRVVDLCSEE